MKKSLTLVAGASLLMLGTPALMQSASAQASGPFADVPTDHWAYQSVDTLQKAGIVIGYPDGTYGGKRAMTRYEFATAIARLLPLVNKIDTSQFATKGDVAGLRSDLEAKLAAEQTAIDQLTKLVDEFGPELQRLGQDVEAIKARLANDEARLAAVEAEQQRIKITGQFDVIGRADNSKNNGEAFTDENGVTGNTISKHIFQSSDVYENFDLGIRGKISDTSTVNVKANFGNYLSSVGNTAAIGYGTDGAGFTGRDVSPGTLTTADDSNVHLREAYLDTPVSLGPLAGAQLQVGRVPVQFSKYTLKEVDADIYTNLYETDSGYIPFDGGTLGFKFGPVAFSTFAGKNDTITFAEPYGGSTGAALGFTTTQVLTGNPANPFVNVTTGIGQTRPTGEIGVNHAAAFTQGAGVRALLGSADTLLIGGTLEEFGLTGNPTDPRTGVDYNKLTVYGADVNGALPFAFPFFKKGAIGVDASYNASVQGGLKTNAGGTGFQYQQHEEQLSGQFGGLSLKGGYSYVGPYYSAPGYWGKLGAWTNPTNVRGPVVSAQYALTPKLALKGDAQFYKAAYGQTNSPLQQDDHVTHYQVGLGYGLSSAYAVDLGYEEVMYDLKNNAGTLTAAGKPKESYINFGLGHSFNNNASFKLLYQIVQYNDKGTGFDPVAAAQGGKADGGVAVGQFSLKF